MDTQSIVALLTVLAVFAASVERVTEMVKKFLAAKYPALFSQDSANSDELREGLTVALAMVVSFAGVFGWHFDPLASLMPQMAEPMRMSLTAIVATFGSGFFNALIDWVRVLGTGVKVQISPSELAEYPSENDK